MADTAYMVVSLENQQCRNGCASLRLEDRHPPPYGVSSGLAGAIAVCKLSAGEPARRGALLGQSFILCLLFFPPRLGLQKLPGQGWNPCQAGMAAGTVALGTHLSPRLAGGQRLTANWLRARGPRVTRAEGVRWEVQARRPENHGEHEQERTPSRQGRTRTDRAPGLRREGAVCSQWGRLS